MKITPYEYIIECEGEYFVHYFDNATALFEDAAKCYAFSDCCDDRIVDIHCEGRLCEYLGWFPGMVYSFIDAETSEIIYETQHMEWDH